MAERLRLWYPGDKVPELPEGQHERLTPGWEDKLWLPAGAGINWKPIIRFLTLAALFKWPDGFNANEKVTFDSWQLEDLIIPMHGMYWVPNVADHYQHINKYERPVPETRVVKETMLMIGRGAGKSSWAAVEAVVETLDAKRPNSNVGLYAASRDQATSLLYEPIKNLISTAPEQVQDRFHYLDAQKRIVSNTDRSFIKVHTGEANKEVGGKHTTAIIDEILAQKNAKLVSTVQTGAGKVVNSLIIYMTTPSLEDNPEQFARIEVSKAESIAADREIEPSFLPVLYCADAKDDLFAWETIEKANPHLACGRLDASVIRKEMDNARKYPSNLAAFKVYRLCMWGEGGDLFIPLADYDACIASEDRPLPSPEELATFHCGIGLDLSRTTDLTCLSLMWWDEETDNLYLLWHHFASEATYNRINAWTNNRLSEWVEGGQVRMDVTGSDRIDHVMVQDQLFKYTNRFNAHIGIDRYDAYGTVALAEKQGIPVQPLRQGPGLAHGIKLVEQQMIDRGIIHNGDPLARWCFQNAEVRYNIEGWSYLVRQADRRSTKIIDPAVAAVMAADRIIFLREEAANRTEYHAITHSAEDIPKPVDRYYAEGPTATTVDWDNLGEL